MKSEVEKQNHLLPFMYACPRDGRPSDTSDNLGSEDNGL